MFDPLVCTAHDFRGSRCRVMCCPSCLDGKVKNSADTLFDTARRLRLIVHGVENGQNVGWQDAIHAFLADARKSVALQRANDLLHVLGILPGRFLMGVPLTGNTFKTGLPGFDLPLFSLVHQRINTAV